MTFFRAFVRSESSRGTVHTNCHSFVLTVEMKAGEEKKGEKRKGGEGKEDEKEEEEEEKEKEKEKIDLSFVHLVNEKL